MITRRDVIDIELEHRLEQRRAATERRHAERAAAHEADEDAVAAWAKQPPHPADDQDPEHRPTTPSP